MGIIAWEDKNNCCGNLGVDKELKAYGVGVDVSLFASNSVIGGVIPGAISGVIPVIMEFIMLTLLFLFPCCCCS